MDDATATPRKRRRNRWGNKSYRGPRTRTPRNLLRNISEKRGLQISSWRIAVIFRLLVFTSDNDKFPMFKASSSAFFRIVLERCTQVWYCCMKHKQRTLPGKNNDTKGVRLATHPLSGSAPLGVITNGEFPSEVNPPSTEMNRLNTGVRENGENELLHRFLTRQTCCLSTNQHRMLHPAGGGQHVRVPLVERGWCSGQSFDAVRHPSVTTRER